MTTQNRHKRDKIQSQKGLATRTKMMTPIKIMLSKGVIQGQRGSSGVKSPALQAAHPQPQELDRKFLAVTKSAMLTSIFLPCIAWSVFLKSGVYVNKLSKQTS